LGVALAVHVAAAQAPEALNATVRLAFVRTDVAPGVAAGPYAGFGALLAQMLTPDGGVTIRYTVSRDAMRAEIDGRLSMLPRGAVILERVGDDVLRILNPAQKIWYEVSSDFSPGMLMGTPDIELQPTGEHATIAGKLADRFRFTETIQMPSPQAAAVPSDFPREIQFTGDLWSTTALAGESYRAIARTMQTLAAVPGMDALTANGRFPLRLYLRSDLMPGYELQTEVASLGTARPDPAAFEVPDDYQKVEPPFGGRRGR
jgi:hypothetical protein